MVHEVAAAGFSDPADYEAARPSYPPEAVDWFVDRLGIGSGARVADLAAGTGKLTRLLRPTGARLLAIEPVPGMRATFRTVVPDVPVVAGTAEAIPLRDASLDAIVVAQAWHWFDHERALAEVRRVLAPGGALGVVWNARDRTVPWVNDVWSVMDRVEKKAPWRDHERDRFPLADEHAEFRHEQPVTVEDVVRRVASVSHVAVLPGEERAKVLDEVRTIVATTAPENDLRIPYRVDCFVLRRV